MQVILSDHNCEGQAQALFDTLRYEGDWLELAPMELKWFYEVDMPIKAKDEVVWQFCQENRYILLTGNRRTDDKEKSLEFAIRRLLTPTSLPVLTIGRLKKINSDPVYRRKCAIRMAEIVFSLDKCLGTPRLYLP